MFQMQVQLKNTTVGLELILLFQDFTYTFRGVRKRLKIPWSFLKPLGTGLGYYETYISLIDWKLQLEINLNLPSNLAKMSVFDGFLPISFGSGVLRNSAY